MTSHASTSDEPATIYAAAVFEYSALQPDTIRIFELFAAQEENEPIAGCLRQVQLPSQKEHYQALSYAWGETALQATVVCDGRTLSITENLHNILRRLRRSDSNLVLWIDGICINQGKDSAALQERAKQIAMMKDIFSGASQVIIDLGPTDYDYRYVLGILEQYVIIEPEKTRHLIDGYLALTGGPLSDLEDFDFWRGLLSLLRLPWFQRLWCFQEFILARRIATLVGSQLITAFDLHLGITRAMFRLDKVMSETEQGSTTLYPDYSIDVDGIKRLRLLLHRKQVLRDEHQGGKKLSLDPIFIGSRNLIASDMRDKVYSIFALLPSDITSDFAVNYDESVSALQHRYSQHLITKGYGLWVLFYAIGPNNHVPSWTLSISSDEQIYWKQESFVICSGALTNFKTKQGDGAFFAGGSSPMTLQPDSIPSRINTVGCKFDHVASMSDWLSPTQADDLLSTMATLYDELMDIWSWADENDVSDDDLWRTLVFDARLVWPNPQFEDKAIRDRAFSQSFLSLRQFSLSDREDLVLLREGFLYLGQLVNTVPNMRIAKTAKGYVAAVPYTTAVGDTIAVLNGVPCPFVLRTVETQYQLLGSCYLHGFMDGEALTHEDWKSEDLTIV